PGRRRLPRAALGAAPAGAGAARRHRPGAAARLLRGGRRGGARRGAPRVVAARDERAAVMRDCIVLGSGRSGTSMVAGALANAGYFMGDRLYPARDANPLGFFEDPEINAINEELLAPHVPADQGLAAPQRWLARLGRTVDTAPEPLRPRLRALVVRQPIGFKDPRFCYTLPAWRDALGDARFVVVFRDPATTAASIVRECAVADYLAGIPMNAARALETWCAMYRQVLQQYRATPPGARERWLFVHYEQMLAPDGSAVERLARHV